MPLPLGGYLCNPPQVPFLKGCGPRATVISRLPKICRMALFSTISTIAIAFEPSTAASVCAQRTFRSTPVLASVADFSGEWCMDLKASDSLGPLLRELGMSRMLAAVVTRLAVTQRIVQTGSTVTIEVKTPLSTETLELNLDGSEALLPGVTGGGLRPGSALTRAGASTIPTRASSSPRALCLTPARGSSRTARWWRGAQARS